MASRIAQPENMVEVQVHLNRRLLQVQNLLRSHLQQAAAVPPEGTNGTDPIEWPEGCPQLDRVQILEPLAVRYVVLATNGR